MSVEEKVLDVIRKTFELEGTLDTGNLKIGIVDNWDSLGHITLFMELERVFRVNFTIDEIEKAVSFNDIVDLIKRKLENGRD